MRSIEEPIKEGKMSMYPSLRSRVDYVHAIKEQLYPPKLDKFIHKMATVETNSKQRARINTLDAAGGPHIGERRRRARPGRRRGGGERTEC